MESWARWSAEAQGGRPQVPGGLPRAPGGQLRVPVPDGRPRHGPTHREVDHLPS